MYKGARAAVDDINARGGILGQRLTLHRGDDGYDPKKATSVANRLSRKGIRAVIGHYCSAASIAASNVYYANRVIQITPASTNPLFTERKMYNVFRMCGRDDQQGVVAGNFLADKFAGKKIGVIHDRSVYGEGLARATIDTLKKRGLEPVLNETFTPGRPYYPGLISRLKASGVDALFLGGHHSAPGRIVRALRYEDMNTVLITGDTLASKEYWTISGKAGQGTFFTFGPDPRKNTAAKQVAERIRKSGYEPEGYTLHSYAAVQAWAQAVEMAKSLSAGKVASALKAGSFNTVLGQIGFDSKGGIKAPGYVVYEWRDGKYDYAE